jgi:myo-inositol-1-phosphate synthase
MKLVDSVRVAIVGVGNCASSLVQGLSYYSREHDETTLPGLMSPLIGPYSVADVKIVAAFDISASKVGQDLAQAITQAPNNTLDFAKVRTAGVSVSRGPTLDGVSATCRRSITESLDPPTDVSTVLAESGTEVVISYLPVGSDQATYHYAEAAIRARCAFINCMPTPLARVPEWAQRFEKAGLPVIGDDVKSQVGATIIHRILAKLFQDRGVAIEGTYQVNIGGNMDFLNMAEPQRGQSKEESKVRSVNSVLHTDLPANRLAADVSYVPGLGDRKTAYIRMEGSGFGGSPITVDLKLEVWDSPNSAGVAIDAVRYAKQALDRKEGGPLIPACAYLMKSPPAELGEADAKNALQALGLPMAGSEGTGGANLYV